MTSKETPRRPEQSETIHDSMRETIPSSEVGVTLAISEAALAEIDQIQEKAMRAAQEDLQFCWR